MCAGLMPEVGVLLSLGWLLSSLIVVEKESWLMENARKLPGNFSVIISPICDVTSLSNSHPLLQHDIWLVIAGPPCMPWSRCQNDNAASLDESE